MKEVYDFIKKCPCYFLATINGNVPCNRPFGTLDIFEDSLYIQTGKVKEVSKQIHKNPNIEISAFLNGSWIRLSAVAIADERVEAKKHMLDTHPMLRSMYDENDDNTEVFKLTKVTATIFEPQKDPKEFHF